MMNDRQLAPFLSSVFHSSSLEDIAMNRNKRKSLRLLIGLMLWAALAVMPVLAQQPNADEINAVAKQLSCPTCTGINVADCPTETCAQWRAKIGELLAEGKSEQEILDYFAARYGDHVLQVPPKRGFFLWVWALPVIAILAGLGWLAYLMRGWVRQRPVVPVESTQAGEAAGGSSRLNDAALPEDEYLRRVQQDLEKLS
jgi:cytochrome c-type biogenesis protein CcmH